MKTEKEIKNRLSELKKEFRQFNKEITAEVKRTGERNKRMHIHEAYCNCRLKIELIELVLK